MNMENFILTEPMAYPQRIVKPIFALTIASALSLSSSPYSDYTPTFVHSDSEIESILDIEFSTKTKMLLHLESLFAELQYKNWDGYDSYPLETASYKHTKEIIESLSGTQLSHWNVFPSPNGTFLLSAKGKDIASINIGNEEFSYAAMQGTSKMMGKEIFKASRVVQIINNIHILLGYGE